MKEKKLSDKYGSHPKERKSNTCKWNGFLGGGEGLLSSI
jgi:hypothetical protein